MSFRTTSLLTLLAVWVFLLPSFDTLRADDFAEYEMQWGQFPPLPDALGVAGPFVGVHRDSLLVAGGANFPHPVWETSKQWVDSVYALRDEGGSYQWSAVGKLPRQVAYGCSGTIPSGVLCIGGGDSSQHFREVFLLQIDPKNNELKIVKLQEFPF